MITIKHGNYNNQRTHKLNLNTHLVYRKEEHSKVGEHLREEVPGSSDVRGAVRNGEYESINRINVVPTIRGVIR